MTARTKTDPAHVRQAAAGVNPVGDHPELTPDEVADLYPGEWILYLITEKDERKQPSRGKVIAHGRKRGSIARAERRVGRAIAASGKAPALGYWIFVALHYIHTAEEWRRSLQELAEKGDWDDPRPW